MNSKGIWVLVNKAGAVSLMVAMISCLLQYSSLQKDYLQTHPPVPQKDTGKIYPMNVHGTIVYLTLEEDTKQYWLFHGGSVIFIILILYAYYLKPFGPVRVRGEEQSGPFQRRPGPPNQAL